MKDYLYLISREDYVMHIDETVILFKMLREMCELVEQLPQNRGSKALSDMAEDFSEKAATIMGRSGIPTIYSVIGDERFLRPLLDEEVIYAIPIGEDDEEADEVFEDEEIYDDEENVPSLEETIALNLGELASAVLEMNGYLHTIAQRMKK